MSDVSFALAIVHAQHIPERRPLFDRLVSSLQLHQTIPATGLVRWYAETTEAPQHIWSALAWRFLAESKDATHGIILQDDSIPCDGFWPTLTKAIQACPRHIVSLTNCLVPSHAKAADTAGLHWVTSNDGLTHGYVMPRDAFESLLAWRDALKPGAAEEINEDTLVNLFAMHKKALIWSPVPAIADHDPGPASTWNNPHTKESLLAAVPPRAGMADLEWQTNAVHAGRVFVGNHRLLLTHVDGPDFRQRVETYYALEGRRA